MSGIDWGEIRAKVPESMLFFKKPEVNVGQLREHFAYIPPRSRIDVTSESVIEFNISEHTSDFINLDGLELLMKVCIKKKNNTRWENTDPGTSPESKVSFKDLIVPEYFLDRKVELAVPIDCFLQTQWKDISLSLNGEEVSKTNKDQAYRSYIDILLRTTEDEFENRKYKWGFCRNEGKGRKNEPNPYKAMNRGGIERSRRFRHGREVELGGKIWIDFLKDPHLLLLNGVKLDLKLTPASDAFRIKVCPKSFEDLFEYEIKDIQLKVPYITLSQNALRGVADVLDKHPIMYPFVRTEFKSIPLHQGIRDITFPEPFGKQVPLDIVMVMVDVDTYNGNFRKDPFYFNRNHLDYAEFQLDNVSIPGKAIHYQSETGYSDDENIQLFAERGVGNRRKRSDLRKMKARKRLKRNTNQPSGSSTPAQPQGAGSPSTSPPPSNPTSAAEETEDEDEVEMVEREILVENANKYDEWQMRALEMLWSVAGTTKNGFNAESYKDGNFLFAIKTDPTVPASIPYWPTVKMGNTSLSLRFTEPIPTEQNLLVLARFPAAVTINKSRNVKVI